MNDTAPANTGQKQRRGRFRKGESGNPGGKRPGTRNRATVLLEAIADSYLAEIIETLVTKAKDGDATSAKILLDRLMPVPRSRAVAIQLTAIGAWEGKDAVLASHKAIVEAVGAGDISPAEGLELVAVVEAQRAAVEGLRPACMYQEPTPEEAERAGKLQLLPWS